MIVVGNVPELGAWSLLKGITLVQEKAGMAMNIREIGVPPCTISLCLIENPFDCVLCDCRLSQQGSAVSTESAERSSQAQNRQSSNIPLAHLSSGSSSFLRIRSHKTRLADEKEVIWRSSPIRVARNRHVTVAFLE